MRNSEKLTQTELIKRAKVLYFDKMENLTAIYADEFGRFSYNAQSLIEQNKVSNANVYKIPRTGKVAKEELKQEKESDKLKAENEKLKKELLENENLKKEAEKSKKAEEEATELAKLEAEESAKLKEENETLKKQLEEANKPKNDKK